MHFQYCKSTFDKRVTPDPAICHQIQISTTDKKGENTCQNSKTSEMHINSREDRFKKIICMKKNW